jgi:hypothetical protein
MSCQPELVMCERCKEDLAIAELSGGRALCRSCLVDTCNELLRERPASLVWSSERPNAVGKWAVRYGDPANRMLRHWWIIEVDAERLRRDEELAKEGVDVGKDLQFAGPIPEPMEADR